jgi:hypothetical protein
MPEEERISKESFAVVVTMKISDEQGNEVDSKSVDFGRLGADQLKGLADIFAMMASNVEYIRKLSPQYEKLGNSIPAYLC